MDSPTIFFPNSCSHVIQYNTWVNMISDLYQQGMSKYSLVTQGDYIIPTVVTERYQVIECQPLSSLQIGHVNEYPTMHYFGLPSHTRTVTA